MSGTSEGILFVKKRENRLHFKKYGNIFGTSRIFENTKIQKFLAYHFNHDTTEKFGIEQPAAKPFGATLDVRSADSTPPVFASGCFLPRVPFPQHKLGTTLWEDAVACVAGHDSTAGLLAPNQFTQRENWTIAYPNTVLFQQLFLVFGHHFNNQERKRAPGRRPRGATPWNQRIPQAYIHIMARFSMRAAIRNPMGTIHRRNSPCVTPGACSTFFDANSKCPADFFQALPGELSQRCEAISPRHKSQYYNKLSAVTPGPSNAVCRPFPAQAFPGIVPALRSTRCSITAATSRSSSASPSFAATRSDWPRATGGQRAASSSLTRAVSDFRDFGR